MFAQSWRNGSRLDSILLIWPVTGYCLCTHSAMMWLNLCKNSDSLIYVQLSELSMLAHTTHITIGISRQKVTAGFVMSFILYDLCNMVTDHSRFQRELFTNCNLFNVELKAINIILLCYV